MKKIGILGGAFNPIHNGHIALAKAALESNMINELWFMPTGLSKYKEDEMISSAHRMEMLKLAVADMPNTLISDIEIEREGYSYTYDTVQVLNKMDAKFYFIIGLDSLLDLPNWYRGEELMDMANFIVAFRMGFLSFSIANRIKALDSRYKGEYEYLDVRLPDISSSKIRTSIINNKSIINLVPDLVEDYINKHNLYQNA